MKKVIATILGVAMVLCFGATSVFAATQGRGYNNYVDENKDGICDYAGTARRYTDADGDGVCDNCSVRGIGRRQNFVDADGDGVCDRCARGARLQGGFGCGNGLRRGCKK